jgi:HAD superfamily hydrolase (TIGR01450 family)
VTKVGWIGVGAMGGRMARRLLDAGHDLVVWNRTPERTAALQETGAAVAGTPAEAATGADVVVTMVADPAALRAVTEGPDGVAAGMTRGVGATLVEMSTVGPAAVARLASVLPAGVGLLDAPVLGSLAEAEAGRLVVFVGGPASLAERWMPLLSVLGAPHAVGPLGSGAAAKLVANASLFLALGALGEATVLARGLGLSPEATETVLAATPLATEAARRRPAIESGHTPARFPLALARKDAELIREAAVAAGLDLRLTAAAGTWLADAEAAGLGARDYTAMLSAVAPSAPTESGSAEQAPDRLPCDGLIVDLDGVVWRGSEPVEGAAAAVAELRSMGVRVVFLTNEPKAPRRAVAARLVRMGIPAAESDVVTSAWAAARVVGGFPDLRGRRVLVVGPRALREEVAVAGLRAVTAEGAPTGGGVRAVVVGGHDGFDYRELRAATAAVRAGARLFATGRDAVFPTPDGPRPGTGAVLAAIETAGGVPAVVVGKPEPVVFEMAMEALPGCTRVAVVGDHLVADVSGAKRAGLASILVLTGVTARDDLDRAAIRPDLVLDSLAELPARIEVTGA